MISIAVWTQYMSVTDRRTDTGRRPVARLCSASRGKNFPVPIQFGSAYDLIRPDTDSKNKAVTA